MSPVRDTSVSKVSDMRSRLDEEFSLKSSSKMPPIPSRDTSRIEEPGVEDAMQ